MVSKIQQQASAFIQNCSASLKSVSESATSLLDKISKNAKAIFDKETNTSPQNITRAFIILNVGAIVVSLLTLNPLLFAAGSVGILASILLFKKPSDAAIEVESSLFNQEEVAEFRRDADTVKSDLKDVVIGGMASVLKNALAGALPGIK